MFMPHVTLLCRPAKELRGVTQRARKNMKSMKLALLLVQIFKLRGGEWHAAAFYLIYLRFL